MEATVDPLSPGSRLDADHPENGVLIPRRFTCFPINVVVDRAVRCDGARLICAKDGNGYRHRKSGSTPKRATDLSNPKTDQRMCSFMFLRSSALGSAISMRVSG